MTERTPRLSEILGGDHGDLDRQWAAIESIPQEDPVERRRLFASFRAGLLGHIAIEEERLFPRLRDAGPSERALADRLVEEHRRIEGVLEEIDRALTRRSGSLEELGFDLMNELGEHNAREEGRAYPWLDEHLSPAEVLDVRRRLAAREPR